MTMSVCNNPFRAWINGHIFINHGIVIPSAATPLHA